MCLRIGCTMCRIISHVFAVFGVPVPSENVNACGHLRRKRNRISNYFLQFSEFLNSFESRVRTRLWFISNFLSSAQNRYFLGNIEIEHLLCVRSKHSKIIIHWIFFRLSSWPKIEVHRCDRHKSCLRLRINRNMIFAQFFQQKKKKQKDPVQRHWCWLYRRALKRPKTFIFTDRAEPSTTGSNEMNEASRKCVLEMFYGFSIWQLLMSPLSPA